MSALVLITLCVFLKVTGRENRTLFPPLIIMLCVTFTALIERSIALVHAFGAGSAVFMVEGLQLIIAALLMVLGVIIVYTSGRELFRKRMFGKRAWKDRYSGRRINDPGKNEYLRKEKRTESR